MMDMWKFISKDGSIEKDATGRQNRIKKDFIMNGARSRLLSLTGCGWKLVSGMDWAGE